MEPQDRDEGGPGPRVSFNDGWTSSDGIRQDREDDQDRVPPRRLTDAGTTRPAWIRAVAFGALAVVASCAILLVLSVLDPTLPGVPAATAVLLAVLVVAEAVGRGRKPR